MKNDERGEEIISALRDSESGNALLPDAVVQCTQAATFEFNVQRQKQLLKAAAFGKALTDEVEAEAFVRTNRIMRVLNQVRQNPGMMISIGQFKSIGYGGLIERLKRRKLFKLAWLVVSHLQLSEQFPQLKSEVISAWARNVVAEADELDVDGVTARIGSRVEKVRCPISFIDVAVEAAERGKMALAYALLHYEPRFRPKVELLLKIEATGEKALECALESHDPDLIYLALLHIHSKSTVEEYRAILRKYPSAASQYAIYCKQHNRKMLEELHDAQSRTYHLGMTHLEQAAACDELGDKINSLDSAAKAFKMGGNDFATKTIDSHKALIEQQQQLEQLYPDERWKGLSVVATIRKVLDKRDIQLATKLKKEFKFNERLFLRLRLVALARLGAFEEFEQLVKGKRPLVSVDQLVAICVSHGREDEAEKYLLRCQEMVC